MDIEDLESISVRTSEREGCRSSFSKILSKVTILKFLLARVLIAFVLLASVMVVFLPLIL